MKKWIIIASIIVCTLFLATVSGFAAQSGESGYTAVATVELAAQTSPELAGVLNALILVPKTEYDKDEANKMINRISRFGVDILTSLKDKGVKIKLINRQLTDEPEYAHLKGKTPPGWEGSGRTWDDAPGDARSPVVVRIGYSDPGYEHCHSSINIELYEISAALDSYVFNNISDSAAFKKLWKKECESVFGKGSYYTGDAAAYFAETFAMYHFSNQTKKELQDKAPQTSRFYQQLVAGN